MRVAALSTNLFTVFLAGLLLGTLTVLLLPCRQRPRRTLSMTARLAVALFLAWWCAAYAVVAGCTEDTCPAWLATLGLPRSTDGAAAALLACHALTVAAVAGMCVARRSTQRQPSMDGQVLQPLLHFGRLLSVRRGASGEVSAAASPTVGFSGTGPQGVRDGCA